MSRPRIAIRADVSAEIGTGHVRRCLSLAVALRELGAAPVFVTRDLDVDIRHVVGSTDFEILTLPPPQVPFSPSAEDPAHAAWAALPWEVDAEETAAALAGVDVKALVVDTYSFDSRWHTRMRDSIGAPLVAIDDLGDRPLAAELIVDHNLHSGHRRKHAVSSGLYGRLLGGPNYALIANYYADAPRYAFAPRVSSIGIFMGGSDAANASTLALDAVDCADLDVDLELVSTSANPFLDRLSKRAAQNPRLALSVDLPNLAAFFARHDLQIGAGGGASWERCCIGPPTLGIVAAENQKQVLRPLHALGAVAIVDDEGADALAIARELVSLAEDVERRRELSRRARLLVDGGGARRVAREVMSL